MNHSVVIARGIQLKQSRSTFESSARIAKVTSERRMSCDQQHHH